MTVIEVGAQLPPVTVHLTRADLVRYAGASGDFNPIHWSDRAATALGLAGVLAHGMLTMGTALRVVTDWVGDPSRVVSYSTRFTKPVLVPDDDTGAEVRFSGSVTAVGEDTATVTIEALCGERRCSAPPGSRFGSKADRWRPPPRLARPPSARPPSARLPSARAPSPRPPSARLRSARPLRAEPRAPGRPHDAAARRPGPRAGSGGQRGRARPDGVATSTPRVSRCSCSAAARTS